MILPLKKTNPGAVSVAAVPGAVRLVELVVVVTSDPLVRLPPTGPSITALNEDDTPVFTKLTCKSEPAEISTGSLGSPTLTLASSTILFEALTLILLLLLTSRNVLDVYPAYFADLGDIDMKLALEKAIINGIFS